MNINIFALLTLILFNSTSAIETNHPDYCGYELLTNLDGRAYTVEHVGEDTANKSLNLILNRMLVKYNVIHFRTVFNQELVDVLKSVKWFYNFDTVGYINRSSTLPVSFECIYGDGWNLPENQPSDTEMNFLTNKFYTFEFFNRLENQIPSNVPLPIFNVMGTPNAKIWVNFAKASHNGAEYSIIVLHIVNDEREFLVIQLKDKKSGMPILM